MELLKLYLKLNWFKNFLSISLLCSPKLLNLLNGSGIVVKGLIEHFAAKPNDLIRVGRALASDEDWTCGFEDELVPLFLEISEKMKNDWSGRELFFI